MEKGFGCYAAPFPPPPTPCRHSGEAAIGTGAECWCPRPLQDSAAAPNREQRTAGAALRGATVHKTWNLFSIGWSKNCKLH